MARRVTSVFIDAFDKYVHEAEALMLRRGVGLFSLSLHYAAYACRMNLDTC